MSSQSIITAIALGLIAFLATLLLDLHRRRLTLPAYFRQPTLAMLDVLVPALTAAFAAALITSLYPAVAKTGSLQLHTPIVILAALCLALLPVFWFEGRKQIQFQRPHGLLFAEWLIFAGVLRILLAFLFPEPEENHLLHAVVYSLPSLVTAAAIILAIVPPFMKKYEGLRILDRVEDEAQFPQPEYTPATPECPQPELWHMLDSQTTEVEVLDLLRTLVTTLKPKLIVETGTFLGHGTVKLAEGLRTNGFGKVITIEFDPDIRTRARKRFHETGLAPWIESRLESSLDTVIDPVKDGPIDLFFSDSHLANREAEIRRLLPHLDPRGILVIHDASSHFRLVREAALRLESEGLISTVLLSTPRGVVIAQRREGRK